MAEFILIMRDLAEVAALIVTVIELYKMYRAWQERRQSNFRPLEMIGLRAAA